MEYREFTYSLKVWLTSIVLAPVIMLICIYADTSGTGPSRYDGASEMAFMYLVIVVASGIFSLLTYIFFYLFIKITVNCGGSIIRIKSIISVLGVGLIIGTFEVLFLFIGEGTPNEILYLMLGNCLCTGWFSWFYGLEANEK